MGKNRKPKYQLHCTIDAVKYLVSQFHSDGQWVFEGNYYQYKIKHKTNISFYPSKRTILFQGDAAQSSLEKSIIDLAMKERLLK